MKTMSWAAIIFLIAAFWLTGCAGNSQTQTAADGAHTHPPVPTEFAGKSNPLAGEAAAAETGKQIYQTNCTPCHGEAGMGDGPAAKSLNPPPLPLATEMDQISDDYLFWRISDGGGMAPFRSAMPAWKGILSEEQIWQVVAFLRTLS